MFFHPRITRIGTEDIKTKIIENLTKNYHVFFHPKMAVYYNKLFKIILGNILQYTIILVVKIILENFWDK